MQKKNRIRFNILTECSESPNKKVNLQIIGTYLVFQLGKEL